MINVTMDQIHAAQNHDMTALGHINSEMESRICQLARKVAGASDREMVKDLEQDGRLALMDCLAKFEGTTVAAFFSYANRTMAGEMTNSRKRMGRSGVSRDAAQSFETALEYADHDPHEAERMVQDRYVMGGPARTLTPELAYAARVAWQNKEYYDATVDEDSDHTKANQIDALSYEMDYASMDEAADRPDSGGRPITWVSAARVLERSLTTEKDKEGTAHLLDALVNAHSNTHTASDMGIIARSRTSRTSKDVHNAYAMLSSLARYETPDEEPNTVTEESRRLAGLRISKVRAALDHVDPVSANIVRHMSGMDDAARTGKDMAQVAANLGLHPDAAKSVYAAAISTLRAAYTGETVDVADGKECSVCHVVKPLDSFHVANKKTGTRRSNCKDCKRAASLRNKANKSKEAKAEENRRYREKMKNKYA